MTEPKPKAREKNSVPAGSIQSADLITAKGNIAIRLTSIIIAGLIVLCLLGVGSYAFFTNPAQSKDLWLIIGPIISGAVSGLVGYEIGRKSRN